MSTLRQSLMHNENEGYFEVLPKSTREIVKEAILKAAEDRDGPEGYKDDLDCLDDVECHSRDGFIASRYNRGGIIYRNFTTLMDYWGSYNGVAHKEASKEIERQIEYNFECISEHVFGNFKELLESKKLTVKDCTYRIIQDLIDGSEGSNSDLQPVLREIENLEDQYLRGDDSSIMHELRFMYHGKGKGLHTASISAAINTEGPYHRSSIPWASNVFCEGAKEIEITWKNNAELKRKLAKAFAKVSKAIF
jgi:hypothetical protein